MRVFVKNFIDFSVSKCIRNFVFMYDFEQILVTFVADNLFVILKNDMNVTFIAAFECSFHVASWRWSFKEFVSGVHLAVIGELLLDRLYAYVSAYLSISLPSSRH